MHAPHGEVPTLHCCCVIFRVLLRITSNAYAASGRLCAQLRGACAELDVAAVSQLLLAGADATAAGIDGRTAAHLLAAAARGAGAACAAGLIVNILLQHGARVSRGLGSCRSVLNHDWGSVARVCNTAHKTCAAGKVSTVWWGFVHQGHLAGLQACGHASCGVSKLH
jgi:hypothetical protein